MRALPPNVTQVPKSVSHVPPAPPHSASDGTLQPFTPGTAHARLTRMKTFILASLILAASALFLEGWLVLAWPFTLLLADRS